MMNERDPHQEVCFHHCEFLEHWDKEKVLKTSWKGKARERERETNRRWRHLGNQCQSDNGMTTDKTSNTELEAEGRKPCFQIQKEMLYNLESCLQRPHSELSRSVGKC